MQRLETSLLTRSGRSSGGSLRAPGVVEGVNDRDTAGNTKAVNQLPPLAERRLNSSRVLERRVQAGPSSPTFEPTGPQGRRRRRARAAPQDPRARAGARSQDLRARDREGASRRWEKVERVVPSPELV